MKAKKIAENILNHYNNYAYHVSYTINNCNVYDLISEIERRYDVDNLTLNDQTKIWNVLRIFIAYELPKLVSNKQSNGIPIQYFSLLKESLTPLKKAKKTKMIFAFSKGENRKYIDDKYYDIYFDPLGDYIPSRLVLCELPEMTGNRRNYGSKLHSKHFIKMHIPLTSMYFYKMIYAMFSKHNKNIIQPENILISIINFISHETRISEQQISFHLLKYVSVFQNLKDFYKSFMLKNDPSAALFQCGYGRFPMACIQACRELNIPTVELQHGVILPNSPAYMKKNQSMNYDCVPNYLMTFGDIFKQTLISGHLFKKQNIVPMGSFYLDQKKTSLKIKQKPESEVSVLFTSQWILDKKIIDFLYEVGKKINENPQNKTSIIFKPHPFDNIDFSLFDNIAWIRVAHPFDDFYMLLEKCDIHATVYSTTGIESLAFGKPTIFVDINNITKNKTIFFADSPDCFYSNINKIVEKYDSMAELSKKIGSLFFKENPFYNFNKYFVEKGVANKK